MSTYVYWLSINPDEKELAYMEASFLLGADVGRRVFKYNQCIDIENAAYIKICGELIAEAKDFDGLCKVFAEAKKEFPQFKIILHKSPLVKKQLSNRISGVIRLANTLKESQPDLKNPKNTLDVFSDDNSWYLIRRIYESSGDWREHINKPHNFSSSLGARYCRSLVNVAHKFGSNLLDPCCGFGSILLEAARLKMNCMGVEINPKQVHYSKKNLEYFGYHHVMVEQNDILEKTFEKPFDSVIVDFPYNLNCLAPVDFYEKFIRKIADQTKCLIAITTEEIDHLFLENDFKIIHKAKPQKGSFVRIVTIGLKDLENI